MINLIETLFGIAIAAGIVAIVQHVRKRPAPARWARLVAAWAMLLGAALELYVRAR